MTNTLELPEDLSPETVFPNLSSEQFASINREEHEGAENNVVSGKSQHSFQMVSFFRSLGYLHDKRQRGQGLSTLFFFFFK